MFDRLSSVVGVESYLSGDINRSAAMVGPVAPESEPIDEENTEGHAPGRLSRAGVAIRGLAIDVTPLRVSRDFRLLWGGELISTTGRQITTVALPAQVFLQTHSSLLVGVIGLIQVVPLAVFSIVGGAAADRVDRRKL